MIVVEPFVPEHLDELVAQPVQLGSMDFDDPGGLLRRQAEGWSIRDGDRLIACAGFLELHPGHALGWAHLAAEKGAAFVAVTRRARAEIARGRWRRVSALIRMDFEAGHRWALLLGLIPEAVHEAYGADGADYACYARIRRG